jgi:glutaredoxin 3
LFSTLHKNKDLKITFVAARIACSESIEALKKGDQMPKNITIYTTNTCAYCVMVKKFLNSKGHNYQEVNLDDDPAKQQEALALSGSLTVPVTVVTKQDDSREVVVGFNLSKLAPAIA